MWPHAGVPNRPKLVQPLRGGLLDDVFSEGPVHHADRFVGILESAPKVADVCRRDEGREIAG